MKKLLLLLTICIAVLTVLVAGCTSPQNDDLVPPVFPVVTTVTPSSTCGFTSCHGLNLACGPNPPEICTAVYQVGDKCRQYAYCSNTGGTCSLVTTPRFSSCRSCIEKCGGGDPAEILSCEEKC